MTVGNDDLRRQMLFLRAEPETGKDGRPGALVFVTLLTVGVVFALVSGMTLLLPAGSIFRRHEKLAWASVALVGLFAIVCGVIWVVSRFHRSDILPHAR
jgi:hypothetical protein